jgi:hypothetical protein
MGFLKGIKRWKNAISLASLCIVWIILGIMDGGLSLPTTLYEGSLLVLLLLTFGMLIHEVRQTASA